jgi:sterol desaturase/sphingolipid hydroxylase (fatty acid hydroxylase superfamily)
LPPPFNRKDTIFSIFSVMITWSFFRKKFTELSFVCLEQIFLLNFENSIFVSQKPCKRDFKCHFLMSISMLPITFLMALLFICRIRLRVAYTCTYYSVGMFLLYVGFTSCLSPSSSIAHSFTHRTLTEMCYAVFYSLCARK